MISHKSIISGIVQFLAGDAYA